MKYIATMEFPNEYAKHKYSLIHFNFFIQYAKIAKVDVKFIPPNNKVYISNDNLCFSCKINDKQVIIDYSDHFYRNWKEDYPELKYFKFQTNEKNMDGVIPLGPPVVGVKKRGSKGETLRSYFKLKENFNYTPGKLILNKQLPHGNAIDRRKLVHNLLSQVYTNIDISSNDDQAQFWKKHENCALSVCVPGACNNMIDRGQMELFGLGVCTISPNLHTMLPFNMNPEPGVHYLQCKDDYSDLLDIINNNKHNTSLLKSIGNNAQDLFDTCFSPQRYWEWILTNL